MESKELVEKRSYTQREYTPQQVAEAISTFLKVGGSARRTIVELKSNWGYSPTEPTLKAWLKGSEEAMNLLDQRTVYHMQRDVAQIIELAHDLLVQELEAGTFPVGKLGTLYGIMVDKYILLNKITNDQSKKDENEEVIDMEKSELINALVDDD